MNMRFQNSWLASLLTKMAFDIFQPEENEQSNLRFKIVNLMLNNIFSRIDLNDDNFFPIGAKLGIIQQFYLGISAFKKENRTLNENDLQELFIASITVALKENIDEWSITNAELADSWWRNEIIIKDGQIVPVNYYEEVMRKIEKNGEIKRVKRRNYKEINRIEKEHLKRVVYSTRLSGNKLAPVFEQYADWQELQAIESELTSYIYSNHEENDILRVLDPIMKQKEEQIKQKPDQEVAIKPIIKEEIPEDDLLILLPVSQNFIVEKAEPVKGRVVEDVSVKVAEVSVVVEAVSEIFSEVSLKTEDISEKVAQPKNVLEKETEESTEVSTEEKTKNIKKCLSAIHGNLNKRFEVAAKLGIFSHDNYFKSWQRLLVRINFLSTEDGYPGKSLLEYVAEEAEKFYGTQHFILLMNLASTLSDISPEELVDIFTNKIDKQFLAGLKKITQTSLSTEQFTLEPKRHTF